MTGVPRSQTQHVPADVRRRKIPEINVTALLLLFGSCEGIVITHSSVKKGFGMSLMIRDPAIASIRPLTGLLRHRFNMYLSCPSSSTSSSAFASGSRTSSSFVLAPVAVAKRLLFFFFYKRWSTVDAEMEVRSAKSQSCHGLSLQSLD